jgi:fibronectin-binding autotransporter adhesin
MTVRKTVFLIASVAGLVASHDAPLFAQWTGVGAGGAGADFNSTSNWTSGTINGSFLNNTTTSTVSLSANSTLSGTGVTAFGASGIQPIVLTLDGAAGGATEVLTLGGNVTLNKSAALSPSITGTWASGATTISVSSAAGLTVGQAVSGGSGILPGTVITAISGTTVTLSNPTTAAQPSNASLTVASGLIFGPGMELNLGSASRTFSASGGSGANNGAITIQGVVSGAVTVNIGGGTLNLTNSGNTFTGNVKSNGQGFINYSSAGALGGGSTSKVLGVNNSSLAYTGASPITLNYQLENANSGNFNNNSTGGAASSITVTGSVNLTGGGMTLGGSNKAALNELSGLVYGTGNLNVGSGISNDFNGAQWRVSNNASTYTGVTTTSGVLEFTSIGNVGGGASSLGAPTTTAAGTITGGGSGNWTLRYSGVGNTSDRQIQQADAGSQNSGSIVANGSGALVLSTGYKYGGTAQADKNRDLTLGGTNAAANSIGPITFNYARSSGANGSATVTKSGVGLWVMTGSNAYNLSGAGTAGTYTTSLTDGVLRLANASAIPGGIGTTGGSSRLSISGGVLELAAGNFSRDTATTASDTTVQLASGGFSAFGGSRTVNFGGASAGKTWGSNGFMTGGSTMLLSSASSDSTVDLQNAINFGGGTRTFQVADGSAAVDAVLSGALSNGGLTKTGAGTLALTGTSTYAGATDVIAGTLLINGDLSATAVTVGSGASVGGSGYVDGSIIVQSGGVLSPGNSPGLLTTGALILDPGSTSLFEIAGSTRGSGYDAVDALDSTSFGGGLQLQISSIFADQTSFSLFALASGSATGSFSSVSATGSYGTLTFTNAGRLWTSGPTSVGGQTLEFNESTGTLVIVPEPTSLLLVATAIGAAVARRRRRHCG